MHIDHDHIGGHSHDHSHDTPMEELLALMQYMVGHNAAHARELAELAHQLEHAGAPGAQEQIMEAVADFEQGNRKLQKVLADLGVK